MLQEAKAHGRKPDSAPAGGGSSSRGVASDAQPAGRPTGGTSRPAGRASAAQQEALQAATTQLQQKEQRIRRLESEAVRKDAELAALARRAALADEQLNEAAEQQLATAGELAALQQAVAEVTAANDSLQAQVKQLPALRQQLAAEEKAVQELRQQVERLKITEAVLVSLQQAQEEAAQQAASRDAQHAAELRCLQREQAGLLEQARQAGQEAAAAEWRPQVEKAQQAAGDLRGNVDRLQQDLRSARAGLPWTPSAAEYAALERRMVEAEEAAKRREAGWQRVAEDSKRAAEAQHHRLQAQHDAALAARDRQVDSFRRQVDGVLAAARLMASSARERESPGAA